MNTLARLWPLAAVGLVVAAWWFGGMEPSLEERQEQLMDIDLVKSQVRRVLPHPGNAVFQEVRYFDRSKIGCGGVSVRQDSGKYIPMLFIAYEHGNVVLSNNTPRDEFLKRVKESCPDPRIQKMAEELK